MSAHTKTHPTNLPKRKASRLKKQRGIPWREAFKADIEKVLQKQGL